MVFVITGCCSFQNHKITIRDGKLWLSAKIFDLVKYIRRFDL